MSKWRKFLQSSLEIGAQMRWTCLRAEEMLASMTEEEVADMIIIGGPEPQRDPCP